MRRPIPSLSVMLAVASLLLAGCEGSSDVPSDQAATDEGGAEAVDPVAVQEVAQTAIDAGTDPGPWVFGHDGSDLETVAVSELTAAPEKFANRKVLVHGTVTSVCQARGCWVEVTDERGDKVVAASFDHGVVLPRNSADLQIDLVGTMYPDPVEEGEAQSYTFSLDGATLRRSNPTEG